MDTFTVRDLRERTGELIRDAESGKLSLVTKHGRPVFVAVPFDETMLKSGLALAFAIRLFEEDVVSLGAAAKLAGLSTGAMLADLGARGFRSSAIRARTSTKSLPTLPNVLVADAGPLIALANIHRLDLPNACFIVSSFPRACSMNA